MVRAPACHAGGRGFEPRLSRHHFKGLATLPVRRFDSGHPAIRLRSLFGPDVFALGAIKVTGISLVPMTARAKSLSDSSK